MISLASCSTITSISSGDAPFVTRVLLKWTPLRFHQIPPKARFPSLFKFKCIIWTLVPEGTRNSSLSTRNWLCNRTPTLITSNNPSLHFPHLSKLSWYKTHSSIQFVYPPRSTKKMMIWRCALRNRWWLTKICKKRTRSRMLRKTSRNIKWPQSWVVTERTARSRSHPRKRMRRWW